MFKEMDADTTLYSLIFGESIFNDAIAIVMYRSFSDMKTGDYAREIFRSFGQFFVVFMGSVLIGASAALLIAFILKR
jgi:NhaP-type Na+/H+ or K+/H+ antiporter